ncbi:unnamed protein product [Paramecium octaurelia]|uniref:Uncharacterized protein n=1 Tax=Paramecium octaurelia TaxID=43137 RepID=A0A8S1WSM5_PAROT|nr:unnamed protein product [Paramecium octaurelia]
MFNLYIQFFIFQIRIYKLIKSSAISNDGFNSCKDQLNDCVWIQEGKQQNEQQQSRVESILTAIELVNWVKELGQQLFESQARHNQSNNENHDKIGNFVGEQFLFLTRVANAFS